MFDFIFPVFSRHPCWRTIIGKRAFQLFCREICPTYNFEKLETTQSRFPGKLRSESYSVPNKHVHSNELSEALDALEDPGPKSSRRRGYATGDLDALQTALLEQSSVVHVTVEPRATA